MAGISMDWSNIDTVLLDMDGTLLDLNFDNHFWQEFVPLNYARQHNLTLDEAKRHLEPQFKQMEGRLEWYCLDYWSNALDLDIIGLKTEIAGLIAVLPHVIEFLEKIRRSSHKIMLVTNAHQASLGLKMEKTCLRPFFDAIVSAHDLGAAKEHQEFWRGFQAQFAIDKQRTLMVDDSLPVLRAAREFGIRHLITISQPDSKCPKKTTDEFPAIADFRELLVGL